MTNPEGLDAHKPLTPEWRLKHVRLGDEAIEMAHHDESSLEWARFWIDVATAHYTAANVRAKPAPTITYGAQIG